jgi:HSP20 family protein
MMCLWPLEVAQDSETVEAETMSITRWDPFRDMMSLREAMQNLFEDSFVAPRGMAGGAAGNLALDVRETSDSFVVTAAMPGVKPEDVDISVLGDTVRIQAEMKEEREQTDGQGEQGEQKGRWIMRERRYGSFQRAFTLPSGVKADQAQATFEHGVLTLTLPKVEEAKPRSIKVRTTNAIDSTATQAPTEQHQEVQ